MSRERIGINMARLVRMSTHGILPLPFSYFTFSPQGVVGGHRVLGPQEAEKDRLSLSPILPGSGGLSAFVDEAGLTFSGFLGVFPPDLLTTFAVALSWNPHPVGNNRTLICIAPLKTLARIFCHLKLTVAFVLCKRSPDLQTLKASVLN